MARIRRVYWIGLLRVIKVACKYINSYEGKLPADLPPAVAASFPFIRAACAALEAYDRAQPRGNAL